MNDIYMIDVYIAEVASLMGDPARANMLCALKNEGALTATELAHVAGVAPSTASEHLAKLTRARMIAVQRQGRHRYYRLARDEVADALESLEALAVTAAPRHRPRHRAPSLRAPRRRLGSPHERQDHCPRQELALAP